MSNITLRDWDPSDYPRLYFWCDQDDWAPVDDSVLRDLDQFIEQQIAIDQMPGILTLAAFQGHQLVGHLRFASDPSRPWIGEGHCYFAPSVRGTGFPVEAARLGLRDVFDTSIQKIQLSTFADGSERICGFIRKLGGTVEGRIKMMYSRNGQLVDGVIYGLTREEFERRDNGESDQQTESASGGAPVPG